MITSFAGNFPLQIHTIMESFQFRKGLFLISNQISTSEVKTLKFYLMDDISRSQLEKAQTGFDIFCLMEGKGYLSPNDLAFLEEVLKGIHKNHYIDNYLRGQGQIPVRPQLGHLAPGQGGEYDLKGFLIEIGRDLSRADVHNIALFFHGDGQVSLQDVEKIQAAEDLFARLLTSEFLNESNLHVLVDVLNVIGRKDLGSKVARFPEGCPKKFKRPTTVNTNNQGHVQPLATPQQEKGVEYPGEKVTVAANTPSPLFSKQFSLLSSPSSSGPSTLSSIPEKDFPSHNTLSTPQLSREVEDNDQRYQKLLDEVESLKHKLKQARCAEEERSGELLSLQEHLRVKNEEMKSVIAERQSLHQSLTQRDDAPLYLMTKSPHGYAIIFVNGKFDPNPMEPGLELRNRRSAVKDLENLCFTFRSLGYSVLIRRDCTAPEMLEEMNKFREADHSNYDSFVCCVSTHGTNKGLYGCDSVAVDREEFINTIKRCPTLKGKPKLFFIQACRVPHVTADSPPEQENSTPPSTDLHPDSDTLVANSATIGNSAYTSPETGSWFVTGLRKIMTEGSLPYTRTLLQLLNEVTLMVSGTIGHLESGETVQQCVEVSTTLRMGVKFFPSGQPSPTSTPMEH